MTLLQDTPMEALAEVECLEGFLVSVRALDMQSWQLKKEGIARAGP